MKRLIPALLVCGTVAALYGQSEISPSAMQQMRDLLQEKDTRTPAQRKLSSQLIYAAKATLPAALANLDNGAGGVLVDLHATVSDDLLAAIGRTGGRIIYSSASRGQIRARIPLTSLEGLATRADVQRIKPGARARLMRNPRPFTRNLTSRLGFNLFIGSLATQGIISHTATQAQSTYGINGSGVKVGVLSDSAEEIDFLIGTGDLPPGTANVQDIIDGPGSSEGSAMMEIVYDMAPGVQLFFASAFNGPDSFADNIRLLRNTYHCDVIVDDVGYSDEFPFQDGVIAQAVNDVTASGAVYLSSAGNQGNLTFGTSSTWEGDFTSGGGSPLLPGYTLHSFGPQSFNRILTTTAAIELFWSDPIDASSNDYDLFVLNSAGTAVLFASTDIQAGAGLPFEEIFVPAGIPANSRIVIAAKAGASPRALHLQNFFGEPLQIGTTGATHGHSGGPSTISVASVYWNSARTGTRPFVGGVKNPTEVFSADGPRKMFFQANGTPITPGNFLFATNGGTTFVKPDIAAADGVTTRTPGFNPFFGTSAAAPHAAGIAALIKSAKPSLTVQQIYDAMTSTALDIQAPGIDRDSGFGIVMALPAVGAALH
jgi:subtilisin family serine protease